MAQAAGVNQNNNQGDAPTNNEDGSNSSGMQNNKEGGERSEENNKMPNDQSGWRPVSVFYIQTFVDKNYHAEDSLTLFVNSFLPILCLLLMFDF